jgi:hypothetical protein
MLQPYEEHIVLLELEVPREICTNARYFPYYEDYLSALDGLHIVMHLLEN